MKVMVIVAVIVVLGLVGGGAWWLMSDRDTNKQTTTNSTSDQQSENEDETSKAASIVTYSDAGFRTSQDTITAGSTVLVINESSHTLQFSSDPHPQHTDNSELNLPTLAPGKQESFVVEEPGRWGFHNHLNDDHSGFITVTD